MDYYDVSPRVVPANRTSEISIRPRFKHAQFKREKFKQEQIVKVLHLPCGRLRTMRSETLTYP